MNHREMKEFATHTGEIVTGDRLKQALNVVADWYAENARATYAENAYANHVTQQEKERLLEDGLNHAEKVRAGKVTSLTVWQRIDTELTGECIALLS